MQVAGKGMQTTGKGVQTAGKGIQAAGKGVQAGGKAVSAGGKSLTQAGQALSSTGVGAIAGVPLMVGGVATTAAGTGIDVAGKGTEMAGKGTEAAGKGLEAAGKGVESAGKGVEKTGEGIEKTGKEIKNVGSKAKEFGNQIKTSSNVPIPIDDETKKAARDGADLGKNLSRGNMLGAAKDASKLASNKKIRKAIIKNIIMHSIGPIILIILIASAAFGIFGIFDAVGETISNVVSGIKDFFTPDEKGAIQLDSNAIDTIINSIAELGVSAEDLKLLGDYEENATEEEKQEATRKYIKKFYEAQAVTETLNYNLAQEEGKTYGAVYVYRISNNESTDIVNSEKDKYQLTYIPYEEMQKYATKTDAKSAEEARKYFSVDEQGNLVYAVTSNVIVAQGSNSTSLNTTSNTSSIVLRSVNYKAAISQYTTKMTFLVYLTMISANPEFTSALADIIMDSRIEITLLDNVSTNVKTQTYNYKEHTRVETEDDTYAGGTATIYREVVEDVSEVKQTTTVMYNPTPKVTYVKTWFCEQKITYNKVDKEPVSDQYIHNAENNEDLKDEPALEEGESGVWKTDQEIIYDEVTNTSIYEEGVRGDVDFSRLGQKGDNVRYENGQIEEPTFVGLLDTQFKLPFSTRTEHAGANVVSGAELLFYLLQKDPELEHLEEIMRYALYLYTEKDYGVTELDGSIFEISDFATVGVGGWSALWDNSITREEFIRMVEDYTPPNATGNSGRSFRECYNKYFVANAGNFYDICTKNGIDPRFVFCIGIHESAYGTSDIANSKLNFFGFGAYDDSPGESAVTFVDMSEGIEDVSSTLKQYVTPGTWYYEEIQNRGYDPTTIEGIGSLYATDGNWANAVKNYMTEIFGCTGSGFGTENGNIVQAAVNVHSYLRTNGYKYEQLGVRVPNTSSNTIDCSSYVTWVLVEAGIPGFESGMYQYTSATFAQNPHGWQNIPVDEALPGDIVIYSGHVEIVAKNDKSNSKFIVYNCGGNSSISSSGKDGLQEASTSGHTKSQAILVLRVNNTSIEE